MNTRFFLITCVVIVLAFAMGCGKGTDLVNGHPAVSASLADVRAALTPLNPAQRAAFMQQHYPDLGQRLVWFLRNRGKIPNGSSVERVDFFFGSQDHVRAEDGAGQTNTGFFKDQLVARVHIQGQQNPLDVLVACLNGTFDLPGDLVSAGMTSLGTQVPHERFTIANGEGLIPHVGFRTAIELARQHHIALYRGKKQIATNLITPDQALQR